MFMQQHSFCFCCSAPAQTAAPMAPCLQSSVKPPFLDSHPFFFSSFYHPMHIMRHMRAFKWRLHTDYLESSSFSTVSVWTAPAALANKMWTSGCSYTVRPLGGAERSNNTAALSSSMRQPPHGDQLEASSPPQTPPCFRPRATGYPPRYTPKTIRKERTRKEE